MKFIGGGRGRGEQLCGKCHWGAGRQQGDVSQRSALAVKEANSILGCVTWHIASRSRNVIIPLYWALIKSHLDTASRSGSPSIRELFINWSKFSGDHLACWGWSTCPARTGWGNWACSTWKRDGFKGGTNSSPRGDWGGVAEKTDRFLRVVCSGRMR